MTTLYLHIGTPKTGTSYIQDFLKKNRRMIKKQGYIYPNFGTIFTKIKREKNGHFLIIKDEQFEKLYQDAIKMIEKFSHRFKNIIISEEGCWNIDRNISRFVNDMRQKNIQVKIVVYLRRQDLFLQSIWAQKIKEGLNKDFDKYLESNPNKLDYYKQCCVLRDIVGEGNIIIRVYEKQQFECNDLVKDFLKTVGLSYDDNFVRDNNLINPSLTGIYLKTKLMLNNYPEFSNKHDTTSKYLNNIKEERKGSLSYATNEWFDYEQQKKFLAKYEDGNQKIAKEFLGREDGILFRDEIINNNYKNTNDKPEEYIDILIRIIAKQKQKIAKLEQKQLKNRLKRIPIFQKIRSIIWKMNL